MVHPQRRETNSSKSNVILLATRKSFEIVTQEKQHSSVETEPEARSKLERVMITICLGGGIYLGVYLLGVIGAVLGAIIGITVGVLLSKLLSK